MSLALVLKPTSIFWPGAAPPNRTALHLPSSNGRMTVERITYRNLEISARRIAAMLLSLLKPGDRAPDVPTSPHTLN
jgi:hypothetical protein